MNNLYILFIENTSLSIPKLELDLISAEYHDF